MKIPPSSWLHLLLALCLPGSVIPLRAQDRLIFKDNHVQDGKVVGMNGPSVLMNVVTSAGNTGQISFSLGLLNRVEAAPPPAYQAGMTAYGAGDWDKALAALKPVAEQFKGLPTPWAQQAAASLGDIYIEKNDLARAEAAYNDYRKLYPAGGASTLRFNLGQARLAFARNNLPQATKQLDGIIALALKDPADASRTDSSAYGQAFYLRGQIKDREGDAQAALGDYLRTVTLFYQDAPTTARAQKNADALRAAHKELVAP